MENRDRKTIDYNGSKIELMDLYDKEEKNMISVKFGNSSSKLCYAVDQSLQSIDIYKQDKNQFPEIEKVGIWLVLERKELPEENGKVDFKKCNLLLLKTKLANWKREARLANLKPVVYINYVK